MKVANSFKKSHIIGFLLFITFTIFGFSAALNSSSIKGHNLKIGIESNDSITSKILEVNEIKGDIARISSKVGDSKKSKMVEAGDKFTLDESGGSYKVVGEVKVLKIDENSINIDIDLKTKPVYVVILFASISFSLLLSIILLFFRLDEKKGERKVE